MFDRQDGCEYVFVWRTSEACSIRKSQGKNVCVCVSDKVMEIQGASILRLKRCFSINCGDDQNDRDRIGFGDDQ